MSILRDDAGSGVRTRWWHASGRSVRLPVEEAHRRAVDVLLELGVPRDDAVVTAGQLLEGDLRGRPAQGLARLVQMRAMFAAGTLAPTPRRRAERTSPSTGLVDAGGGLGPPAMAQAVALARAMLTGSGVTMVGVRGGGHIGVLGSWAEQLAGGDSFAVVISASEPAVVLPGGATAVFGTNPIAYACPTPDHPAGHLTADFSTSAMSRSELLRRTTAGEPVPLGTANGPDGQFTTDPARALAGGLLPFGSGHRGVLLSLLVAVLAGPLVGGPPSHRVTGTRFVETAPDKADVLLAVRLDALTEPATFHAALREQLTTLEGAGSFRRPGTGSHASRSSAAALGVEVDRDVATLLGCGTGA